MFGYKTQKQATEYAQRLLSMMPEGKGWRIDVHQNDGWHFSVVAEYVSVHATDVEGRWKFWAMISDTPDGVGSPSAWCDPEHHYYNDPVKAVQMALDRVKEYRDNVIVVCDRAAFAVEAKLDAN